MCTCSLGIQTGDYYCKLVASVGKRGGSVELPDPYHHTQEIRLQRKSTVYLISYHVTTYASQFMIGIHQDEPTTCWRVEEQVTN